MVCNFYCCFHVQTFITGRQLARLLPFVCIFILPFLQGSPLWQLRGKRERVGSYEAPTFLTKECPPHPTPQSHL